LFIGDSITTIDSLEPDTPFQTETSILVGFGGKVGVGVGSGVEGVGSGWDGVGFDGNVDEELSS
jgi:hypothetical protein